MDVIKEIKQSISLLFKGYYVYTDTKTNKRYKVIYREHRGGFRSGYLETIELNDLNDEVR